MRTSLVVLALASLASPALADDSAARVAAARTMLATQTNALVKGDDAAFRATLTPDALISTGGEAPRPARPREGFAITLTTPRRIAVAGSTVGWAGTWGWVAAELRVTWQMYAEPEGAGDPNPRPRTDVFHWFALVVADGDTVKTRALQVTSTVADRDLVEYDYAQGLVPMASPSPQVSVLAQPAAIATALASDPATAVFGSSARDRGLGAAAARKLVRGWSKLALEVVDSDVARDRDRYRPLELTIGDAKVVWARLRMKLKGKQRWVPLQAFAIMRQAGERWEIVALGYAAAD